MIAPSPLAEPDLTLDRARLDRIRNGAVVITTEPSVFQIAGTGAVQCLQGLLTNDVVKPGDHSLVYGALLTPKGAIVVDYWVARMPDAFILVAPPSAREASLDLFRRQLPPRLARVTDLTGEMRVAWLVGAQAFHALVKAALGPVPESAGHLAVVDTVQGRLIVALAPERAPFAAFMLGPAAAVTLAAASLREAGACTGGSDELEAARILAGWPALGLEIDERTLPQEVRYDEIGGVSYTKGCYTGQETVARLHFRGHTNRELRGLRWAGAAPLAGRAVLREGKEVGTVRSTLALGDRILGLTPLRREVKNGEVVEAGGREALVVALPFGTADLE
jgi:tRNA-modifying protein YgfZ